MLNSIISAGFESILVPEDKGKENPKESYANKYEKYCLKILLYCLQLWL